MYTDCFLPDVFYILSVSLLLIHFTKRTVADAISFSSSRGFSVKQFSLSVPALMLLSVTFCKKRRLENRSPVSQLKVQRMSL